MGQGSGKLSRLINYYGEGDDSGKVAIVTGSNSGIGFEAAKLLAKRGITTVMACRSVEKADRAKNDILSEVPQALLRVMRLDLASQNSVKEFAGAFLSEYKRLDLLVNNAGVMATPYSLTEDGFEMQFGTNHLGHFTLNSLLLDRILNTGGSRVVTISSIAHFNGSINFDDLKSERSYSPMVAYRQSKLANLLFSYELDRRLKKAGSETIAVAVHPGITSTNIVKLSPFLERLKEIVLMNTVKGALSTLMGAFDPDLKGGEYIGPDGFRQMFGFPAILKSSPKSHDPDISGRLWDISEELTGLKFKV